MIAIKSILSNRFIIQAFSLLIKRCIYYDIDWLRLTPHQM